MTQNKVSFEIMFSNHDQCTHMKTYLFEYIQIDTLRLSASTKKNDAWIMYITSCIAVFSLWIDPRTQETSGSIRRSQIASFRSNIVLESGCRRFSWRTCACSEFL